jgi:RNA polymerase sigma-70 factor (ECF subfamily)
MRNNIIDDDELVIRLLDREEQAVELLFNKYSKVLLRVIKRYADSMRIGSYRLLTDEDCEEVLNDTIVTAVKKIDQYNSQKGSFKNWLFAIGKNKVIDRMREVYECRSNERELKDEQPDLKNIDEIPDDDPRLSVCKEALNNLPQDEKDLIIADVRIQDPERVNDMFEKVLGLSRSNIKTKKSRAYKYIREYVKGKGFDLS